VSLPRLIDQLGREVPLERELASGGEGIVYTLRGDAEYVAKVYRQTPSPSTVEKLRWMVNHASDKLTAVSAWPTRLLLAGRTQQVAGFVMANLSGYEPVHHLYNPAQRIKYFPRATWAFLVHVARNTAAAFDELHPIGVVVGDVNQSNLRVSRQGFVRLIDCDSFQVTAGSQVFPCEVGVAHYTPPELQGKSFHDVLRTENHDRFGLAVLLFQLLFVGRHPYAGVYQGAGELSFEQAIAEYRFAYGPRAASVKMASPPFTPTLAELPPVFAELFGRAFERGSQDGKRPDAALWCRVLGELAHQLAVCATDAGHHFWKGTGSCVWCRIVGANGPDYFLGASEESAVFRLDEVRIQQYLKQLQALEVEVPAYRRADFLPSQPATPTPLPAVRAKNATLTWTLRVGIGFFFLLGVVASQAGSRGYIYPATPPGTWLLFFGVGASMFCAIWLHYQARDPRRPERDRRLLEARTAENTLYQAETSYQVVLGNFGQDQRRCLATIVQHLNRCRGLRSAHDDEVKHLAQRGEELARDAFLRQFLIADAVIPKIGEGRKQMLAMYNILTAADLDPAVIDQVHGFGTALIAALMNWRAELLRGFTYDRTQSVPEAAVRGVAIKYRKLQQQLLAQVGKGVADLAVLQQSLRRVLAALEGRVREAVARWVQATADLRLLEQTWWL
jgi:DNA-binding helix-hairpin-helix protein with protein kinase domain